MPPLLPSEVARLVYGELERCNCNNIAELFLNESPHLEECREFVSRVGEPSFMTKAYGLSLRQILKRYLDMWNLILEQTNNIIPNTRDKFSDPVDALIFILSTYEQTSNELYQLPTFSDDIRWKTVTDNETSSNFSLQVSPSGDATQDITNERIHRSYLHVDTLVHSSLNERISDDLTKRSSVRQKKQNCYLDELYASTDSLENSGPKKRLKVLKPRQPGSHKSSVVHNVLPDVANNFNLSEDCGKMENNSLYNTESRISCEKDFESSVARRTRLPEQTKRTNMQLRSFSKVSDDMNQQTSSNRKTKASKKRKCPCSPERERVGIKQTKMNKLKTGKENDAQVDFTKIPQLLIEDPKWPELIAENINKKILESPQKKIDTLMASKDNVIESIAEKTLEDDLTDEFIRGLLGCAQNIAQEKNSTETNISLLNENPDPLNDNSNCENDNTINRLPESVNIDSKPPTPECTESNAGILGNTDYTRLHEDMNEFVQFNHPKESDVSSGQSGIIVIEVPETEQISMEHCSDFVIESQTRSAHSNYVVCSTNESSITDGKESQDEIIAFCSTEQNNVEWNASTASPVVVTTTALTNANTKLQICGSIASPTKIAKRNYRPIAPKPNSVMPRTHSMVAVPDETNSENKSKSLKKSRK